MAIVLGTSLSSFLYDFWTPAELGLAMIGVAVTGFVFSLGITRVRAEKTTEPVPLESLRRRDHRHQTPAARPAAVADGHGHLLFLGAGRAVPIEPAAVCERSVACGSSTHGVDDHGAGGGVGRGQPAGGETLGRPRGFGPGAGGVVSNGSCRDRVGRFEGLLRMVGCGAADHGTGERTVRGSAVLLSSTPQREQRKRPHDGHQQFLQHAGADDRVRGHCGCFTTGWASLP